LRFAGITQEEGKKAVVTGDLTRIVDDRIFSEDAERFAALMERCADIAVRANGAAKQKNGRGRC